MGVPEIIALVSAVVAVVGAAVTWGQVPRPSLVMPPIYIDDTNWHKDGDQAEAVIGIQNQGSGPALAVTLHVMHEGKWMQTKASDYVPALAPGESVALRRGGRMRSTQGREHRHMSGVAGLMNFEGLKIKIRWRSNWGWWREKVFDVDSEHNKSERATRLDPSVQRYLDRVAPRPQ